MSQSYTGSGWAFPSRLSASGRVVRTEGADTVHQAVWMLLSTARGERPMEPEYGCGIYELVFAPGTGSTLGQVRQAVVEALVRWEPRIDVLSVQVEVDISAPERLLIQLEYRIRSTNSRFNLVYPFYVE